MNCSPESMWRGLLVIEPQRRPASAGQNPPENEHLMLELQAALSGSDVA
jgi:hypothetical protein